MNIVRWKLFNQIDYYLELDYHFSYPTIDLIWFNDNIVNYNKKNIIKDFKIVRYESGLTFEINYIAENNNHIKSIYLVKSPRYNFKFIENNEEK